jgi:phosphate transport system permease protein
VIGNRPAVPHSLLAPGSTLGAEIVNQFAEAISDLQRSSVIALALIILVLTALVNGTGQLLLRSRTRSTRLPRGLPDPAYAAPGPDTGGPTP